jgi:hypothetical protein
VYYKGKMNEIPDTTKIRRALEEKRREDKITVDLLELGRSKVDNGILQFNILYIILFIYYIFIHH